MGLEERSSVLERKVSDYSIDFLSRVCIAYGGNGSSSVDFLMKTLGKFPPLSFEEQTELLRKSKEGDEYARDKIACHYMRFVMSIADNYIGRSGERPTLSLPDLVMVGTEGLLKAISKYDEKKGRLSTYAMWWIKQSMQREICRSLLLPIPLNRGLGLLGKVGSFYDDYLKKHNRCPSVEEISEELGIKPGVVSVLLNIGRYLSLDNVVGDDGSSVIDNFPDKSINLSEDAEHSELQYMVNELLDMLSHKEKMVIRKRYGFVDGEPMTLKAIGSEIGLSRERVRQIEKKALERLRKRANLKFQGLSSYVK